MERRRAAVANLGSTWLKPVGVSKTLFQMREEQREAEEHAEALRREMLAQELAEAEAAAAAAALDGDDMMVEDGEEGDLDGGRDLDADIPDEDAGMGFGYDGGSDEEEDNSEEDEEDVEEEEEEEEDDDEDDEGDEGGHEEELSADELERRREIARIRATEARMREIREQSDYLQRQSDSIFDFDEEPVEEERSQMLEEEDLVRGGGRQQSGVQPQLPRRQLPHDMDMDADLDDDIPVAESGGYEHTDSDASLHSDHDVHDLSYARSSQILHHRSSLRRSGGGPRSSLDISGLLSRDGSSIMGSSPYIRRGNY
ncbi:hypothetical protein VTH06DRAFT_1102 [Thermothelomyces fergusii]